MNGAEVGLMLALLVMIHSRAGHHLINPGADAQRFLRYADAQPRLFQTLRENDSTTVLACAGQNSKLFVKLRIS